jgi:heat shock protein HslJ
VRLAHGVWVLCVLGLGACAHAPREDERAASPNAKESATMDASALAGTRWTGVVAGNADARTLPRLEFVSEGRLVGFTGCNMLSGTWKVEEGAVRIGPLAMTKRMCAGPEGEVERRLLAALGTQSKVTREGQRLVFTAPGGARFEFDEAAAG